MQNRPRYSILIPAYDAETYLAKLLSQVRKIKNLPVEIVVVNDGSTDNTEKVAEQHGAVVLTHRFNMGKGAALKTGFRYFTESSPSDYLLCMDADLQHPVEEIPKFIEYAEKHELKFIIGNRLHHMKNMPLHRKLSNKTTSFILSKLTKQHIKDSQCGYRLIHKDVLDSIELQENGFQLESEMIIKVSDKDYRIGFVDIQSVYNNESSQIRNISDTLKFISLILRSLVSNRPWSTKKN